MSPSSTCELLILADGRVLAHNLTGKMAGLLSELDPEDKELRERAESEALAPPPSVSAESATPGGHPLTSR